MGGAKNVLMPQCIEINHYGFHRDTPRRFLEGAACHRPAASAASSRTFVNGSECSSDAGAAHRG